MSEEVGQLLFNRVTGSELYRVVACLEPGLIQCVSIGVNIRNRGGGGGGGSHSLARTYRRVEASADTPVTYDEVRRTGFDDRWEFIWIPSGPGGKRIGRLQFATDEQVTMLRELEKERQLRRELCVVVVESKPSFSWPMNLLDIC
jgi:hypothetical protein